MPDTTVSKQLSLRTLTVANATEALAQGLTVFDLSQVETVDSAAVSVMLAWQRAAAQGGIKLELRNLPGQLQSLTKLYGVCTLVSPADLHHH
jgi:phospholipid transport system transporter-binding protein